MPTPIPPQANQESVWDYPRPPRVEKSDKHIVVLFNGITLVDSTNCYRVLETSHPPTYYIPQTDMLMTYLTPLSKSTFCEFKGNASYWTVEANGKRAESAGWMYANPAKGYEVIRNHIALYASKMDACYVNGELVQAQAGDFYGGWITAEIIGPFKGGIGTRGW